MDNPIFNRTELLVGGEAMERIAGARVIVFGVGGVGSWCAEGLVRSGVGHLTMVDSDCVSVSNINRQLMATTQTVGWPKVEVLRERLLQINPQADIVARQEIYCAETHERFHVEDYDYVVDAIDSLSNKLELIVRTTERVERGERKVENDDAAHRSPRLFSSMGAALKMDPTRVRVSEFWEVDGCPLAAALRRRMRRQKRFPGRKFKCVWSPEVRENRGGVVAETDLTFRKAQVNGSMVHITAIMGFTLVGLILDDLSTGRCL